MDGAAARTAVRRGRLVLASPRMGRSRLAPARRSHPSRDTVGLQIGERDPPEGDTLVEMRCGRPEGIVS